MGIHTETTEGGAKVNGYPAEYSEYYVYCDNCGSFNIKSHISLAKQIIISIIALSSAAVWNILVISYHLIMHSQQVGGYYSFCCFYPYWEKHGHI